MPKLMESGFDRTYCYSNGNVLKNKLDVRDMDELHDMEREYTSMRLSQLEKENPIRKTFDKRHLQDIHRHIFQDVYEWAGEFRTVDIAKSNMFCRVMFMDDQLEYVFRQLRRENCLEGIDDTNQMGERLAYYLSEINAVHPFREGNGRTQREFIRELAEHNGYHLDYSKIPQGKLLQASIKSFTEDHGDMATLITNALTKNDTAHMAKTKKDDLRLKLDAKRNRKNDKPHKTNDVRRDIPKIPYENTKTYEGPDIV